MVGVEKPDPRIYKIALEMAGNVAPEEALHIGDSMRKDYTPARSIGMHALLLDRFKTADAESWRQSGATVLPDLVATQEWLTKNQNEEQEETVAARVLNRISEKLKMGAYPCNKSECCFILSSYELKIQKKLVLMDGREVTVLD